MRLWKKIFAQYLLLPQSNVVCGAPFLNNVGISKKIKLNSITYSLRKKNKLTILSNIDEIKIPSLTDTYKPCASRLKSVSFK